MAEERLGFGLVMTLRDAFSRNARQIETSYNSLDNGVAAASERINRNTARVTKGFKMMAVGAAIVATFGFFTKTAASFEAGLSKVGAVSNATAQEMVVLEKTALDLGASTAHSARQVTDAQRFLAMAGFSVRENVAALPGVLDLASAVATDLGRTSDIASDILSGFGLKATSMGRVADTLAKTFTSSNTTLEMLGETMKFVGPIATKAGVSLEQVSAMAGLLGNVGIKGTLAGTSLRNMLTSLAAPTSSAAKALSELGIKTADDLGNLRSPTILFEEMNRKLVGLGSAAKLGLLENIFGKRGIAAAAELIGKAGTGELQKFTETLQKSTGTAAMVATRQLDNLEGAVTLSKSAWEGLSITIGKIFIPLLTLATQGITKVIGFFDMMAQTTAGKTILAITAALGAFLFVAGAANVAIGGIGIAMAKLSITTGISAASISASFAVAFLPIMLGIAVIASLKRAWDANLGGIQNKVGDFLHVVATTWEGIISLITSGKISGAMRDELDKMGLWGYVKTVFMVVHRIGALFTGIIGPIKSAFIDLGDAFLPIFSAVWSVLKPIGTILFQIAHALGFVGASMPTSAFEIFGKVLGHLIAVPLRIFSLSIKAISIPIQFLWGIIGKIISAVSSVIGAIPDFLLPSGLGEMKGKIAAGAMSLAVAATPVAAARPEPSTAGLLAAHRTSNISQVFNNQRTEAPATPPTAPAGDQRPLEVNLNIDGRQIHRTIIRRDEEEDIRQNG